MPYAFMQDGSLATCNKLTSVPEGVEYVEFELGSLPATPKVLTIVSGEIVVDPDKLVVLTKEAIEQAIQKLHEDEVKSRGYDDTNSIAKYIGYDNLFRTECEALGKWIAGCWAKSYELQSQWEAGNLSNPTVEYVMGEMPDAPA